MGSTPIRGDYSTYCWDPISTDQGIYLKSYSGILIHTFGVQVAASKASVPENAPGARGLEFCSLERIVGLGVGVWCVGLQGLGV